MSKAPRLSTDGWTLASPRLLYLDLVVNLGSF